MPMMTSWLISGITFWNEKLLIAATMHKHDAERSMWICETFMPTMLGCKKIMRIVERSVCWASKLVK